MPVMFENAEQKLKSVNFPETYYRLLIIKLLIFKKYRIACFL